jgi:hypothetical protein
MACGCSYIQGTRVRGWGVLIVVHELLDAPSSDDPDARPLELADTARVRADTLLERRAVSESLKQALTTIQDMTGDQAPQTSIH